MATAAYSPDIHIFGKPEGVDVFAAQMVIETVQHKPDAVLMVAAGNSTKGMIARLIAASEAGTVSFGRVRFVGLDEYWRIGPDDPISTAKRMWENFFSRIGVAKEQLLLPDGNAADLAMEVCRFAGVAAAAGRIDLAILGMGPGHTCHIGMNGPGSEAGAPIRAVALDEESITAMMNKLQLPREQVPTTGITVGMAEILAASHILVLALGESKAWGVKRSLTGAISPEAPASLLRLSDRTVYAIDTLAAGELLARA